MNKTIRFLRYAAETLPRVVGLDVFIERSDTVSFLCETHSSGCREFWGFGLHVVISSLRYAPKIEG